MTGGRDSEWSRNRRHFGSELRRYRELAGMTQDKVAKDLNVARTLVTLWESGKRVPGFGMAERLDLLLGTRGELARFWPLIANSGHPVWFSERVDLEEIATRIREYESRVIPGLLQTAAYAKATFDANKYLRPTEWTEERVTARLARQQIMAREEPPELWFVIDETALRRMVGSTEVMREQYEHLLKIGESPYVLIQILPLAVGPHAGLAGPVSLLDVPDQGTVVYAEGAAGGHLLSRPEDVQEHERRYDLLRADALSHADSARLIRSILENL